MQYFRVAVPNVKDLQRVEPQSASEVQSATVQKFPAEWRMQNPLAQSLPLLHEAPGSAAPLTELCELFRTSTHELVPESVPESVPEFVPASVAPGFVPPSVDPDSPPPHAAHTIATAPNVAIHFFAFVFMFSIPLCGMSAASVFTNATLMLRCSRKV